MFLQLFILFGYTQPLNNIFIYDTAFWREDGRTEKVKIRSVKREKQRESKRGAFGSELN